MDENDLKMTAEERDQATEGTAAAANPTLLPEAAEYEKMNETEQQAIETFSAGINVKDARQIREYGSAALKRMAELSESARAFAEGGNLSEIGQTLGKLASDLKAFGASEQRKRFFGIFGSARRSAEESRDAYDEAVLAVSDAAAKADENCGILQEGAECLSGLYEKNLDCYKLITMYLFAGRMRIARDRETTLASMREIARRTNLPQDSAAADGFENALQSFEKKLHDLEITRVVCMQVAPILRRLQSAEIALSDEIRAFTAKTIPLWQSHAERATKDAERGNVNAETLKRANETLLASLNRLLHIHAEKSQDRKKAASELELIESDLKKKLLELQD